MADDKREQGTRQIGRGGGSKPVEASARTSGPPTTELQRWAAGIGAAPRVTVPEMVTPKSRPATRPTMKAVEVVSETTPAPRYLNESPLGRGGVGEVDLALDRDLNRKVAKKRLRSEYRGESLLVQAFLEEAMITGALEHPGIVPVHDIGVSPGEGPWYTMKCLEGEPLANILSRMRGAYAETIRQWPLARLIEVFVQAVRAVAHAHGRHVVHCDLKPGNIVVGELGEVVVVDWGLAKVLGEGGMHQARARLWSGSPGYMPPEQATSEDVWLLDQTCDVWALGAILYELMVLVVPQALSDGTVPEPAEGAYAPIVPLKRRLQIGPYRREVPPALEAIAERAIALDPKARFQSVLELLGEVEAWLAGTRERERRETRVMAAAEAVDALLLTAQDPALELGKMTPVVDQLIDALRDAPDRPELTWRGSSMYWVVFRVLHRSPNPVTREAAMALLDRLAALVVPEPGEDMAIGPWLDALEEVADDAPRVRSLANRLRALNATPLFATLGGHELVPVASAVDVKKIPAGQPLFTEGEPGDALWVLVTGEVAVEAGGKRLTTMSPPAAFGEIAMVDHSTRTASVIAVSDVLALTLTAEKFDGLVRKHGAIAMGVMRLLAERLRTATAREVSARG